MSTFTIFLALIIIVAFLLIVVIMVQNPKGGGLSSSFGGGGGAQLGGVKKTTDFLDKSTWTLATLLLVLILLSNVTILDGTATAESRVIDGQQEVETNVPQPIQATCSQS
ncbi:preprotein translocase subunit SecG [Antarcticibacterium sp. 1MA-6-2]|uniref:preprotein translocase subunit SecG n=1 Tax=Antarcticibacterium sp. 1MA-6-2 TaxID=2908210 RepID=UPI001F1C9497|nr:preprotein translocase subunit SecG [Antarcticibacterium sp. 1MA-6-2]UJH90915.1 preprotein translocase subunit SecG [Antarcticibacterium sp. 1MA-6-2]